MRNGIQPVDFPSPKPTPPGFIPRQGWLLRSFERTFSTRSAGYTLAIMIERADV
jgi:hypothetical protein